jgi:trans-2,3-dihydro-3-hydroxyanthranilate isomerase
VTAAQREPGPTLAYELVDVFTDRAFAGNPLAVVLDTDGMTTEALQALANEFNLSETAFPQQPTADGADYRLRIFTPGTELPFAGHPSVGAAWVMARLGRVARGRVVQECGAGLLPLEIGDDVTLSGGTPVLGDPLDPAPLLAAVGLSPDDLAGAPRLASTGLEWVCLQVRDEAVARARPLHLDDLPGAGVSVFSLDGREAHARVFAGGVGVTEDPATGSAALALGVHLAGSGLLTGEYTVRQGAEIGRPSVLRCTVTADGHATVRGDVVPVARGEIARP